MSRIDELQKKYPNIHRDIIVKWEMHRNGIADSADLDKVSTWERGGASYNGYDYDITMKEYTDKRPGRSKEGFVLRPGRVRMKRGLGVQLMVNTKSPYELREVGSDRFVLFEGEEKVDHELFYRRPKGAAGVDKQPLTNKGTPIYTLVNPTTPTCFAIIPVRHCEYFATGEQCKFCNFNAAQDDLRSVGTYRPVTVNQEEVVEAYKIRCSMVRQVEGRFEMGGFKSGEGEIKTHASFIEGIANAVSYKPNFTIQTQVMTRKDMQRLKDAGLDCLTLNVETMDPKAFPVACPGKSKRAPHERWLEAMVEGIDVFGPGNVGYVNVPGLSMLSSNGYVTWEEDRDTLIESTQWAIKNGIFPITLPLRMPPGSVYGGDPSNREKRPPTEYYLDYAMAHHKAMKEQDLYSKLNRFMYCGFECVDWIYAGEMGILELAGDLGSWMADVVPAESNWMAEYISSINAPAQT